MPNADDSTTAHALEAARAAEVEALIAYHNALGEEGSRHAAMVKATEEYQAAIKAKTTARRALDNARGMVADVILGKAADRTWPFEGGA